MRAAAEKAASARPEAGGNRAARGAVGGRGTSRGNARHDVRASSSSTYQLFLAMLRHGSVWGSLLAMYTVMMVVIIAEGRRHAEWRGANTVPRALWMSVKDEPVLCLSPPSLEYVRYAVGLLLSD
ncbi:hypothetical protein F4802DRAFT_575907 [Xylaria palmicola]|nr:hypothetical protein F4802DRAFT_575907 [Xylaria palmicola]